MVLMQCVGCGANLEIEVDMGVFACAYCGSRQQVIARGGTIALKPITEAIRQVQRGTDRTAAELAMPRLERELAENAMAHKAALAKPTPIGINGAKKIGGWMLIGGAVLFFIGIITAQTGFGPVFAFVGVWTILIGGVAFFIGRNFLSKAQKLRARTHLENINDTYGGRAEKIARQIKANRTILDAEHTTV